jgi:hypothetical protein
MIGTRAARRITSPKMIEIGFDFDKLLYLPDF